MKIDWYKIDLIEILDKLAETNSRRKENRKMKDKKITWESVTYIYEQLRSIDLTLEVIKRQLTIIENIKRNIQLELIDSPDIIPDDQEHR